MGLNKTVCKDCTKRELGCHSWCPDWEKEHEEHRKEKEAIWKAKNHPADLYLGSHSSKYNERNKKELKEKHQRIGRSGRRP